MTKFNGKDFDPAAAHALGANIPATPTTWPDLTFFMHTNAIKGLSFILCLASVYVVAELPADEAIVAPPRYKLHVGQELVYRLVASEDFRDSNGNKNQNGDLPEEQREWRITVVRKNEDGSWRLFIRTKIAIFNRQGRERFKKDSFGSCDLRPDGSYSVDEQTAIFNFLFPYELFCLLPDTSAALNGEWCYQPPVDGKLLTYRIAKSDGANFEIAAVQRGRLFRRPLPDNAVVRFRLFSRFGQQGRAAIRRPGW